MKVKSQNDFQSLDEELNLFEESEWDFMRVVDTQEENFEFFDDIPDIDYDERRAKIRTIVPFVGIAALIIFSGVWLVNTLSSRVDLEYERLQQSLMGAQTISYVEGDDVSSEDFISINQMLASYFNTLQSKSGYDNLNVLCMTDSTFATDYQNSIDKMTETWDVYDCNARAMSEFGTYIKLNKIDKAVLKDNTYYIYCNVTVPSKDDIYQYIHLYSYNLTKYFNSNEVNQQNVARFLIDTMETNPLPTASQTLCIEVVKSADDGFKIVDDSEITSICDTAYNYAISQITKILGNNLSDESF